MVTAVIIGRIVRELVSDRLGGHRRRACRWPTRCSPATRRITRRCGNLSPARSETQYGKARRVWVMDRGIPSEAVLAEMRQSDPPVRYLSGHSKAAA